MSYFLTAFNHNFKRASRVRDLLVSVIEAAQNATAQGAEIIDLRDKPNAQPSYRLLPEVADEIRASGARVPRRVSPIARDEDGNRLDDKGTFELDQLALAKVPGYVTSVTVAEVIAVVESMDALKRQARLVAFIERRRRPDIADPLGERVLASQGEIIDRLRALDPSLFDALTGDFDKAHIPNFDESIALDVSGFAWTASDKGYATETRYRDDRAIGSNSKRDMAHADMPVHRLDEDALLAA